MLKQDDCKEATLAILVEVPDARWPSTVVDPQPRSAFALRTHQYMRKIHDKSRRLCSDRHDSEALTAIDLKGRCGDTFFPLNAGIKTKFPYRSYKAIFSPKEVFHLNKKSVEDDLLKQYLVAGPCNIL